MIPIQPKIIIAALTLTLAGVATFQPAPVSAHWFGADTTFVTKFAQKLGLGEDKVKVAVDSIKADHHAEMQKAMEDRLTQAVSEGKITDDQKQKILAKHKEMFEQKQKSLESMKDMTPEERKEAMKKHHTELETWAKENNIDIQYLFGFGKRSMKMFKMKH